ncbi:MAG: endolytic transglycosylase MltG [bacterium]
MTDTLNSNNSTPNRSTIKLLLFGLILSIIIVASTASYLYIALYSPPSKNPEKKIIEIKLGMKISEIGQVLEENLIIRNRSYFVWLVKFKKVTNRLKAGEYEFRTNMNLVEVLDVILAGKPISHIITIPEGFNIYQIADLFDKEGLVKKEEFIHLALDKEFVQKQNVKAKSLEGYLFPDTYNFPKLISPNKIISKMTTRFNSIMNPSFKERAKELSLTIHEVIILASIIEKETGNKNERELISAVYHNRLKKKMRLQCDPTVIYGLKFFDGNLTKKHLKTYTPYNTYRKNGLPVGPIANPGRDSIKAALYPADVDYLYFVSKNDGTHQFSTTLEEHNRAVRKYQKRRRKDRR